MTALPDLIEKLKKEEARVCFMPIHHGDGYQFGGDTVLIIGSIAIPFGAGEYERECAREIAHLWNRQSLLTALQSKEENDVDA